MPSLYFTTSSCGAASYIAAKRGGVKWDKAQIVDLPTHKVIETGEDFYKINPKGNVPTIVLEDGSLLNENVGTLYWIAKNSKQNNLLGKNLIEECHVVNMLGYLTSEIHKAVFAGLWSRPSDEEKERLVKKLHANLEYLANNYLSGRKYLVGNDFTVADAYLYIMLTWPQYLQVQLPQRAQEYKDFIGSLAFVKEAHAEMQNLMEKQKSAQK